MARHMNVTCDSCTATNFEGVRYRCEICINYDLCSACYDAGKESLQHIQSHPMECIPEPIFIYDTKNAQQITETEYLTILLDYCRQRFIEEAIYATHINSIHFKERFADALNWTNGFIAKLSGSRLTGLVEQYFIQSANDQISVKFGDMDIMFEPKDAFISDIDTGDPSQIGFVEISPYSGFYYIEYNLKTKFHSILKNLDIFEEKNNKQYISSKKLTDLLHKEFSKYEQRGPCSIELHGPAVSAVLNDGIQLQDFVFSLPMLKIPDHIREQWLNRSKQWPSIDVIEMVSNSICHVVPKRWCNIDENEEDPLTWRLSLSFAEVLLTNAWNKKQKDCYILLKSFIQELAPDILSSHHIKTFMFTYIEQNNHMIQQIDNHIEMFLNIIQCLSLALKRKTMQNYFIPTIDMLRFIPKEKCLYLAEKLDQFYLKPVETIMKMTKNFLEFTQWSRIKIPSITDYSKINICTWYLRSLLCIALKGRDYFRLKCLEHIVELSNKYFPSSLPNGNINNVEELMFSWLNIILTPLLRKKLSNCFEQTQQQREKIIQKYNNKRPIWLRLNLIQPIVFVFNIIGMDFDEEFDEESDDDDECENEESNNDPVERSVTEKQDDCKAVEYIVIPFLKLNGTPTNTNDYNRIPVTKERLQNIFELLLQLITESIIDLPSCYDLQYLIDQFHDLGFKNEVIKNAFYEAALAKSVIIFKLKNDLYAIEKNDPICVNVTKEQNDFVGKRYSLCYEQMKNLFHTAIQLSTIETWKIKVHMGYTYYFLFGHYDDAIDLMKIIIEDYNTDIHKSDQSRLSIIEFNQASNKCPILTYLFKKLNKDESIIPTIVIAYYTLFQCYRLTGQWDNGQQYIEQFKQICAMLDTNFKEDYDQSIVKLLLATCFFCSTLMDEGFSLTSQFTEIHLELADELMSLCGIQILLALTDAQHILNDGLTIELPYALAECGGENEQIHIEPGLIKQLPPRFIVRHGYDCYKMRSWLIKEITILDELEKWISRLPVADILVDEGENN